ncbi:hypothetical protein H102_01939 [Trichophyton rubrum CBS 100081]|nr:hypothetical protein H102_01939 [Trichophyton rubrum CBS 100081]
MAYESVYSEGWPTCFHATLLRALDVPLCHGWAGSDFITIWGRMDHVMYIRSEHQAHGMENVQTMGGSQILCDAGGFVSPTVETASASASASALRMPEECERQQRRTPVSLFLGEDFVSLMSGSRFGEADRSMGESKATPAFGSHRQHAVHATATDNQ